MTPTTTSPLTWTGFVDLLLEMRGRMPLGRWAAIRDEAHRRRFAGHPVELADLVAQLDGAR